MANITAYDIDLCCMAAFIVDRRSYIQLEKIIGSCLHTHVPVEYTYYMVGIQRQFTGRIRCFFCQQFCHVHSLVVVLFYKEEFWQMDRIRLAYYLLAHV